jgi:NADH-quinone oxidoreductase subunit I
MSAVTPIKDFFSSFMLLELLKGIKLTGRHFFQRNDHRAVPGRKDAAEPSLPWPACATPLREW